MSSKRHIRRKACLGKNRYETSDSAWAFLRRTALVKEGGYNVYHCKFCGGYHVGHMPRPKGQHAWIEGFYYK